MRTALKWLAAVALLALVASDAQAADTFGKTPVKTSAASDVQAQISGSDGVSLAQVAAANGAAAGNGLFVLGAVYNSSLPSFTSGRSVALQTDVNGRLIITQDASAGKLAMNLAQVGGSAITLGSAVGSSSLPVVIASDQGNLPGNLKQVNGSSISLGQTTMSASLPVTLASNQSNVNVSLGAPSGSSFVRNAATNIAAGSTATIVCKSSIAVSTPTKPLQWTITSAGAVRCVHQYNDNASLTKFTDVATSPANMTVIWTPPTGIVGLTTSSTSTTQQYESVCTNFDSTAQDVYCDLIFCSSATGC